MKQSILYACISILMALELLVAVPVFAQSTQGGPEPSNGGPGGWGGPGRGSMMQRMPGVFGSVSAISGDTITLDSKTFGRDASSTLSTTYSVDATNATVFKDGATSTLSGISVNDMLMVQGTVSGTNVAATRIEDGIPQGMPGMRGGMGMGTSTRPMMPSIQGNGEPVIGGSVSAVNGNTLTVTNKSNVTYSVDASNATVVKNNATSTLASILSGDNVIVQGTVNGTSVTASSVIDQGATKSGSGPGSGNGNGPAPRGVMGIFGNIGGFFQHLFGFF